MYSLVAGLLLLGFTSCECLETTRGIVLDYASKKPIAKVSIHPLRRVYKKSMSDSMGRFEVSFISGFFEKNGCKKSMTLVLTKSGYDSLRVQLKNQRAETLPDTVFLKRK